MDPADADAIEVLTSALEKATKLLNDLRRQQAEVEASPPALPAPQLQQGRTAMNNAVASTQRMVDNLQGALEIARAASN
jgi:hypothetical protein